MICTCTVTDLNGCVLRLNPGSVLPTFTLTEPAALDIAAVPSLSTDGAYNINCNGGTGSINITVTGGSVGTYSYAWSTATDQGLLPDRKIRLHLLQVHIILLLRILMVVSQ